MAFVAFGVAYAQALPSATAPVVQPRMIDGKLSPSKIPDSVARRMLFHVLGGGPGSQSYARRVLHLKPSGLAEAQAASVIQAATVYGVRLADGEKTVAGSTLTMDAKTQTLRTQRDRLISELTADLEQKLGFAAMQKLRVYLDTQVKTRISMTEDE